MTIQVKYAAIAWSVLAILFGALMGALNLRNYWRLADRGVATQGTVIRVLPEMHATVRYRYRVAGAEYLGQNAPGPSNPPISQLTEGATLTVYYDPKAPGTSVIGAPSGLLKNEIISVVLAAFLFPTFIVTCVAIATARRARGMTSNRQ